MKIIYDFNEYLLENTNNDLPFKLSKRLRELLLSIRHTISDYLLRIDEDERNSNITLLDLDDKDFGKFRYVISNKVYDIIINNSIENVVSINGYLRSDRQYQEKLIKNLDRYYVSTSIGKSINKIFPNKFPASGKPGLDIESFTNMIKHKRSTKFDNFKLVEGEDIIKYYNSEQYSEDAPGSTLGSSCMRYTTCKDFINFYAKNKGVKLLILYSDDKEERELEKIKGRALVWDISEINEEKVENVKFMDRIYTVYDYDVFNFIDYAKKEGWLYKNKQNMSNNEYIINPKTGEKLNLTLKTTSDFKSNFSYPYMDTMKWFFYEEGFLSNSDDTGGDFAKYLFMEHTNGDADQGVYNGIYVPYYEKYFRRDDIIWCEYGEEYRLPNDCYLISDDIYATNEYIQDYMVWSNHENKYIDQDDSYWSEYYQDNFSTNYVNNKMHYIKKYNDYYLEDDIVYSDIYESYIPKDDSIKIYTEIDKSESTYILFQDKDNYLIINDDDGKKYFYWIGLKDYFITVITSIDPLIQKLDYKSNEYKYFKIKGKYYLKKYEDELTGQLKLNL